MIPWEFDSPLRYQDVQHKACEVLHVALEDALDEAADAQRAMTSSLR